MFSSSNNICSKCEHILLYTYGLFIFRFSNRDIDKLARPYVPKRFPLFCNGQLIFTSTKQLLCVD